MKDVFVHDTATVETKNIGSGTRIWHYAHVREGASIGKNCTVGHCAYVGKDVKIGNNVKIENKASVFQGADIGNNCFIGPHVVITNDPRPRSEGTWKVERTVIEDGASIGAGSTIICGITIGRYSMIGSGSVVTRDVPPNTLVYGNPAKARGFVCNCGENLKLDKKDDGYAVMKCVKCRTVYKIPSEDYAVVVE